MGEFAVSLVRPAAQERKKKAQCFQNNKRPPSDEIGRPKARSANGGGGGGSRPASE
jgi:hypothetical protein